MKKWIPLISVSLGTFMLLIDTTIVQVALPDIAADLDASYSSLQWVIDGYVVALAALMLGVGSLADRLGHRRTYVGGLALFAVASAMCGAAPNDLTLVVFRIVQGVGAAALFATTTALLNATYQGADRGKAFGLWAAVASAAAAVGPIIGGVLVQTISWRWIFFVNLPICVAAVVLALGFVAADRAGRGRRVDPVGVVTFTIAAAALMYVLIDAGEHGWNSVRSYVLIAVVVAASALFVGSQRLGSHPMIDLSLFRRAGFNGVLVAALVVNFVAFAPLTYTSIWLQGVENVSAIGVGLSTLPLAGAAFLVSWQAGRALHRLPPGRVIAAGLAFVALGSFINAALLHGSATWPALMAGFTLIGVGTGLAVPTLTAAAMSSVPPDRGGIASGTVNTARQLGFAIGIALLGAAFTAGAAASLATGAVPGADAAATALSAGQAANLIGDAGASSDTLRAALHDAALAGLDRLFLLAGGLALAAALAVTALVRTGRGATQPPAGVTDAEPAAPVNTHRVRNNLG